MRPVLLAATLLLSWDGLLPAQSGPEAVPLTVAEPAGVDRVADPVTTGVPFAPGVLVKGAKLKLTDSAGRPVPLQTRELAYWSDGSVNWLLVDFQASMAAGKSAEFTLTAGEPAGIPARGVATSDTRAGLVIDTGPLQAVISRERFSLFESVRIDGAEKLTGPGRLAVTDVQGKVRTSRDDPAAGTYRADVVESGPLRTVVKAEGEMQANAKYRIGFTCWYHFFAGSRSVRVFLTIRNLDGKAITATDQQSVREGDYHRSIAALPGNVEVEAVDLVVPLVRRDGEPALLGGDGQVHELPAGRLYQDSSASWTWQAGDGRIVDPHLKANKEWMDRNVAEGPGKGKAFFEFEQSAFDSLTNRDRYVGCSFRGYKVFDAAGKETAGGDRSPGWVRCGDTTVAVRWFWQMYPKSIRVAADGTVALGLWPAEWSRTHVFEGHIHKTHELLFAFGEPAGAESAQASFTRFDRRLLAVPPADYACSTGAFGSALMPENRTDFARFEDWALTAVQAGVNPNVNIAFDSSLAIEREKYDHFGVWHFGDTSKRGWRGFGQYLELDIPYCLMAHFARTGNRAFFDEAEIHTRQLMDVPAHGGGYGHQAGESSHYYTAGAFLFHYMTGLDFVRDSIRASHDLHAKPAPWHARSFAITMWSNLDMYRHFGEPRYLDAIGGTLAWFARGQDPATGFRPYGQTNFQEFMLGMMMDALGQYCTQFPDDLLARDRLVALSMATMRTHRLGESGIRRKTKTAEPDKPWRQNNSCCNGHTWAYLFSGRDRHLDFAAELLDESLRPGDERWPVYRTGTGSGKYWSEFGHRNTQTHMWARWHRARHGTPKPPPPVADLTASVADGKLTLVWTAPATGRATGFVAKLADRPLVDELLVEEDAATAANWWTTPVAGTLTVNHAAAEVKITMALPAPGRPVFAAVRAYVQEGPVTAVSDLGKVIAVK